MYERHTNGKSCELFSYSSKTGPFVCQIHTIYMIALMFNVSASRLIGDIKYGEACKETDMILT